MDLSRDTRLKTQDSRHKTQDYRLQTPDFGFRENGKTRKREKLITRHSSLVTCYLLLVTHHALRIQSQVSCLLMFFLISCVAMPPVEKIQEPDKPVPSGIEWRTSFREAMEMATAQNKPVMLVFSGVSSKRLDDRVFSVPDVIKLAQNFSCFKVDVNQSDLIDKYKIQDFPTVVFTDPQGVEYDRFSGYRSWQTYAEMLKNALIPVEAEYKIQITQQQTVLADVECVFKNVRWRSLILSLWEKHDKISNISYSADERSGWEELDKNVWQLRFDSPGMRTVTIKYQVGLNITSRFSLQPEYASYVGNDYGVLDGRALFMEPQGLSVLNKVKVHVELPSGWDAITPWENVGHAASLSNVGEARLFHSDSIEEVVDSVFCIGRFQFAKRVIGEHEVFAIYSGGSKSRINLEERADEIVKIFKDYVMRFGDFPFKRYLAVFTDQTPDGKYITGSSAHVVGFAGPVLVDYSFIAHEIFHVWNGGVINQKSDYEGWFKEGFTQYYGYLTPYRLGIYGRTNFLRYLEQDYEMYLKRYEAGEDIALARVKEEIARKEGYLQPNSIKLRTMYNKGALVAAIIDNEIRKRTSNTKSLDDLMYYMFQQFQEKRYSTEDILEALNKVAGQDIVKAISAFIYGRSKLPSIDVFSEI